MQTNVKIPIRMVEVNNSTSTFTLKVDKKQLTRSIRKLGLFTIFVLMGVLLFVTYTSESYQFWSLVKVSVPVGLVAVIAFKSKHP